MSRITDWDDAYANGAYIAGGDAYPDKWRRAAESYRQRLLDAGRARLDIAYGRAARQRMDLFLPATNPVGLAVFVHGGYWLAFDKSSWSHLAAGAVDSGWAVAIPSYTLAPEVRVPAIARDVAAAIALAAETVDGPIRLAGHSAGGHLVTRMICADAPLGKAVQVRIRHVLSISGLHDLRPLLRTTMAGALFSNPAEAAAESPALLEPVGGAAVTCWVGAEERPEFLRQNELLANVWTGLGAETHQVRQPGRHHFNVIEDLAEAGSPITQAFVGERG